MLKHDDVAFADSVSLSCGQMRYAPPFSNAGSHGVLCGTENQTNHVASVEAAASLPPDLRACCKDFWMTVSIPSILNTLETMR